MLHGGDIVVLNGGSGELRFFDLEGRHVRSTGRKGGGPGEIERGLWLGKHAGDSLAVYDVRYRRISIFDRNGNFGRVAPARLPIGHIHGRLADGTFVLEVATRVGRPDSVRLGFQRDTLTILLATADSAAIDTLASYPGVEWIREIQVTDAGASRVRLNVRPFGLFTATAAGDSSVYMGSNERWAIDVLDRSGTLRRSVRRSIERAPLTDEVIARWREAHLSDVRTDDERRRIERVISSVPFPERIPAHGALRVDDEGNLWVEDFRVVYGDPVEWTVFDRSGRMTARITTPSQLTIYQSGADFVLGVIRDELDVQHVVLYYLEK